MTPERKAEIEAELDEILGPMPKLQPPRPKVVVSDAVVVRDADVVVSPADFNASPDRQVVRVRRPEPLLPPLRRDGIDHIAADRQYWQRERDRESDRAHRQAIDPFNLGHWGRWDD